MGGKRKPKKEIKYTLIYSEGGERKTRSWEMLGQTTGKKFKTWHDKVSAESLAIIKSDGVDYLASSWRGFEKRR